jgi:hypothetical protein
MCKFLSAIVMKSGEVICHPDLTDSHEDLLAMHNIRDGYCQDEQFVRVEFTPSSEHLCDPAKWALCYDTSEYQSCPPDWYNNEMVKATKAKLQKVVEAMVINDDRAVVLGGCWILGPKAYVSTVRHARVYSMEGRAQIRDAYRCRIGSMCDGAEISYCNGSDINIMTDTSRIGTCEYSSVDDMYRHATIGRLEYFSNINYMSDNARVCRAYQAHINSMTSESRCETAARTTIQRLGDEAAVVFADSNTIIEKLFDKARVVELSDSSKILEDCTEKKE